MPQSQSHFTESLSLKLGTPESAADAAAVSSMLRAIVVLIEETEQELNSDVQLAIRVRPFVEGSFEIPIDLIVIGGATLFHFTPELTQILANIKQYVEIKKLLKGAPTEDAIPASGITVGDVVINGDNNVVNVIQSPHVSAAMHEAFVEIEKDPQITDVRLENATTGEEIAKVLRHEFPYFRYPDGQNEEAAEEEKGDRVRGVRAMLIIRSPVLLGTAKWRFTYEGHTISADMKDQTFLKRVQARSERFAAGDRLEVDLAIGERFNPEIAGYESNGQYAVKKVHHHIQPPEGPKQKDLFPDDE